MSGTPRVSPIAWLDALSRDPHDWDEWHSRLIVLIGQLAPINGGTFALSQSRLGTYADLDPRVVRSMLWKLERHGWIKLVRRGTTGRPGGKWQPGRYRLTMPAEVLA